MILRHPEDHDPVFRSFDKIRRSKGPHNYARERRRDEESEGLQETIRQAAEKRYRSGFPPRKPTDTAMGDSLSWEWLIHAAAEASGEVWLVTRDGDFGAGARARRGLSGRKT